MASPPQADAGILSTGDIRVVVVARREMTRYAMSHQLAESDGITIVGEAGDGSEALEATRTCRPDVVVASLAAAPCIELLRLLRDLDPGQRAIPIVATIADLDARNIRDLLRAGVAGLVCRDGPWGDLVYAIHAVRRSLNVVCQHIGLSLYSNAGDSHLVDAPSMASYGLTVRERQVLNLILRGLPNREIASSLVVSLRTVEMHAANVMHKVGAKSRPDVIVKLLGQHQPPDPGSPIEGMRWN